MEGTARVIHPLLLLRQSGWAEAFDGSDAPADAVSLLRSHLGTPAGRVLLAPVGSGPWIDTLAGSGLRLSGLDPSRRILAAARERLLRRGITVDAEPTRGGDDGTADVVLVHGDLREAECNPGHAAAVLPPPALAALGTRQEREDALRTIAQAMRPGATCVVVQADPPESWVASGGNEAPVVGAEGLRRNTEVDVDVSGRLRVRHRFVDGRGDLVAETGLLRTALTDEVVFAEAAATGLVPSGVVEASGGLRFLVLMRGE
jgi:SAM-dependent methyltransferase